ncbi:MAG: trigger factor [Chloroflexi bacterium]|nr:trigger factor [Chloroflexota bacterium]
MKIEKEFRDDQQVLLTAELDSEVLEQFKHRAARNISKQAKISGFRPGKAPYDVVLRLYGEQAIEQEAIELIVEEYYPRFLDEAAVDPSGPGTLQEIVSINPPKFNFLIPLRPSVELCDYRAIRKDYNLEAVTDEDISKVIENLRQNYAESEPVDRPAQEGDLVFVKITGKLVDAAEDEAPVFNETPAELIVGGNEMRPDNWPYDGFTKELVGMTEGQEKVVHYSYPEDFASDRLKGKAIDFTVQVQSVKVLNLPEINEEFIKNLGDFDSVDAFKAVIREQMETDRQQQYDQDFMADLIDETIVKNSTVKYPPQLLEHEIEHVLESIRQDLAQNNLDLDTYLKIRQSDKEKFIEEEVKPAARLRLERSLVLEQIAEQEKVELNPDEVKNAVARTLFEMQSMPDYSKYKKGKAFQNLASAVTMDTANRMYNRQILNRLKDIATGKADQAVESATDEQPETPAAGEESQEPAAE